MQTLATTSKDDHGASNHHADGADRSFAEDPESSPTISTPTILRKAACPCGGGCSSCQSKTKTNDDHVPMVVRRERSGDAPERVPGSVIAAVNSPGRMLPDSFRRTAERHFEKDLSHIRLHDDPLAATAVAESRAHALAIGNDILLSRGRSDLSRSTSQKTLAHEIAHTLQPDSASSTQFEPDNSSAETDAHAAAESFVSGLDHRNRPALHNPRRGVARERDPRLDQLVEVVDAMPLLLNSLGIAEQLHLLAPDLDLEDPDNYEPLRLLLDEHFGPGFGDDVIAEWQPLQSQPAAAATPEPRPESSPSSIESADQSVEVVAATEPGSMTGTQIESEIALLREALGMSPLDPDAPTSDFSEPSDAEDRLRLERLVKLETEYFYRRRLLESVRETAREIAQQQRSGETSVLDVLETTVSVLVNPAALVPELLGNPVEDFATGFLPGFLAGAVLELPRDVFTRLDAETRAHPIQFNGGVIVGIPVGALEGLWDIIVGLVELLQLAEQLSPTGLTRLILEEAVRSAVDDQHTAERMRQLRQAQAIGESIVDVIRAMISDPAFMIAHGEELGEIAGRAAGDWFATDFMEKSTFDKGYLVGKVEGRILFEVIALFLGPEEWIARGASLIGEGVRISSRLSRAIIEVLERIPALRRLLTASREASTVAREAAAGERVLSEAGEAISDASRLTDEASDLARAGDRAEDLADPARLTTPAVLDPADLRRVGEVNPETIRFFERHPERLRAWAENPVARRACKLCSSPCFPENVNPRQADRLEALLERAEVQGLTVREHVLHDELAAMTEAQIDDFIAHMESRLPEIHADDLTSLIDDAEEATRSIDPESIPEAPSTSREAEETAADLAEARLTSREPWRPPPGATPRPPDTAPITERLQWLRDRLRQHVEAAVEHFRVHGVTTAQEEALVNNPQLYPAFRGSRIDQFAKDTIMQDLELGDLITAPDFVAEPDILSSALPEWFDITTARAWQAHLERYAARYGEEGVLLPTR